MVKPKDTSAGREQSCLAKGQHHRSFTGALHHHHQMGLAHLPALALLS